MTVTPQKKMVPGGTTPETIEGIAEAMSKAHDGEKCTTTTTRCTTRTLARLRPGTRIHWLLTELHAGRSHTPLTAVSEGGITALHSMAADIHRRYGLWLPRESVTVQARGGRKAHVNRYRLPPHSPEWQAVDSLLRGAPRESSDGVSRGAEFD